jgi:hypothetical protein
LSPAPRVAAGGLSLAAASVCDCGFATAIPAMEQVNNSAVARHIAMQFMLVFNMKTFANFCSNAAPTLHDNRKKFRAAERAVISEGLPFACWVRRQEARS